MDLDLFDKIKCTSVHRQPWTASHNGSYVKINHVHGRLHLIHHCQCHWWIMWRSATARERSIPFTTGERLHIIAMQPPVLQYCTHLVVQPQAPTCRTSGGLRPTGLRTTGLRPTGQTSAPRCSSGRSLSPEHSDRGKPLPGRPIVPMSTGHGTGRTCKVFQFHPLVKLSHVCRKTSEILRIRLPTHHALRRSLCQPALPRGSRRPPKKIHKKSLYHFQFDFISPFRHQSDTARHHPDLWYLISNLWSLISELWCLISNHCSLMIWLITVWSQSISAAAVMVLKAEAVSVWNVYVARDALQENLFAQHFYQIVCQSRRTLLPWQRVYVKVRNCTHKKNIFLLCLILLGKQRINQKKHPIIICNVYLSLFTYISLFVAMNSFPAYGSVQ